MEIKDLISTFSGKRIFITGHTGFKGSWLAFLLNEVGAEVTGYALPPKYEKNNFSLLGLSRNIKHIEADIRDDSKLLDSINECQPEYVFHLAAQALVMPSYRDPKETFDTNISGSVNMLEAVRKCDSIRSLVFITSDKCYENKNWTWGYRENDSLGGHDPYSASKAAAEIIFSSYVRSFFSDKEEFGASSTRAGNVIGGGDWSKDRIIPDCMKAIESNTPLLLRNPMATRPWQHVLEPLSGYLLLAKSLKENPRLFSGAWNFGPDTNEIKTVEEVVKYIFSKFDYEKVETNNNTNHYEAALLQLNCDKAKQELGWNSRWDIKKTLDSTAEWYKRVQMGEDAVEITSEQIHDYFNKND